MNNINEVLAAMAADETVRGLTLEFKRTTGGVRMTYELRRSDGTSMGLEFVDKKDATSDVLVSAAQRLVQPAVDVLTSRGSKGE